MQNKGCYWVGFLMRDRLFNRAANTAAVIMWKEYEKGKIFLLQRKRDHGVWEYWWYRRTRNVEGNSVNSRLVSS